VHGDRMETKQILELVTVVALCIGGALIWFEYETIGFISLMIGLGCGIASSKTKQTTEVEIVK